MAQRLKHLPAMQVDLGWILGSGRSPGEGNEKQAHRSRMWNGGCQGLGEEGIGKLLFNGYRVSVKQDKKNFEDLLHINIHIVNNTIHLKYVKRVNFMFFATIKIYKKTEHTVILKTDFAFCYNPLAKGIHYKM